jgi:hypothetical protein
MRSLVASIALVLVTACAGPAVRPEAPTIAIDTVRPFGAEGPILRVMLGVRLHNPNGFALKIQTLTVALNGRASELDGVPTTLQVPPASDLSVEIARRIPMETVASALLPLGGNTRQVLYDVNGVGAAAGGTVAFTGKGSATWRANQ